MRSIAVGLAAVGVVAIVNGTRKIFSTRGAGPTPSGETAEIAPERADGELAS